MARPLRLEFAGALYHVTARGDRQEDIYETNQDRTLFLSLLGEVCNRFGWICHGYCLMTNHYHLLIETPNSNLSKGMRQLNGVYTQRFNRVHSRVGHVFQGRYKAILVDKNSYLLELARYIVLNPVRARMVHSAEEWRWSSYRATTGQAPGPEWLKVEWLLAAFGQCKAAAIDAYKGFVAVGEGQPSPWEALKNQVYLGDEEFVEKVQSLIDADKDLSEIPSSQRSPVAKSLQYYESISQDRNSAIISAYASGGYSMKEVGDHFGLHYSRISRLLKAKGKT